MLRLGGRGPREAVRACALAVAVVVSSAGLAAAQVPTNDPPTTRPTPVDSSPPAACTEESEPNDQPEAAPVLSGEICVTGTLVDQSDQDLLFWDVAPEDGLTSWAFTVRGVPATITSAHVYGMTSAPGVLPLEGLSEVFRADSDAHLGSSPVTTLTRLPPGRHLVAISRGTAGFLQQLTDDRTYELLIVRSGALAPLGDAEPNDDTNAATPVAGAFELSGDLMGSEDHYRWTLSAADAGTPWRLEARTAMGASLELDLRTASGDPVLSVSASPDGTAILHDLDLAAGAYQVSLSPAAGEARPYELTAAAVTELDVDREPNDLPELATLLDPITRLARGRLASDADVDQYVLEVDAALAANLMDVTLDWSNGLDHSLCLLTEDLTPIGCQEGEIQAVFPGLMLSEGRYLLTVSGAGDLADRYELRVSAGAALPPNGDVEPNDDAATASPVEGAFSVGGDLAGSADTFSWTVSEADAAKLWRLELSATPGLPASLALSDAGGALVIPVVQTGAEGTARVLDLRLPAGDYTLAVAQVGGEAPRYVVRAVEETAVDIDPEPNDAWTIALPLDPATLAVRGRLETPTAVDVFGFDVDAAMATTLVDVGLAWADGLPRQLCLATKEGSVIQCRTARDGITLADLALAPDRYTLQVSGAADLEDRYELRVTRGRAPAADRESEPNDLTAAASPWDEQLTMHGSAVDGDTDIYRVSIDGPPELWRLDITGSGLGVPEWLQPDGSHVGAASVSDDGAAAVIEDLYLVAGDHLLRVTGEGEYTLALTSLGAVDVAAEREPNDDADHAGPIAVGGTRTGRLATPQDVDTYRFSLRATDHVVLRVEPPPDGSLGVGITAAGMSFAEVPAPAAGEATIFDGSLPPGDYEVWLRAGAPSTGTYSVDLERADPFVAAGTMPDEIAGVSLSVETEATRVASFSTLGQVVDGAVVLTNEGPAEVALTLDAATSHDAWTVDLPLSEVSVAAGSSASIPFTVHVPPDAWRGVAVRVTLRAREMAAAPPAGEPPAGAETTAGAQVTASVDITPEQDVAPVAPEHAWAVPDELLGGLDVASLALGAVPTSGFAHDDLLHDGLAISGSGDLESFPGGPLTFGVDLAGDEPVPVAGIIVNPLGPDRQFTFRPRAFELLLSEDGVTFTPALSGEMSPLLVDQPFVLDTPVPARFAQLRIDSTWGGTEGGVSLGEWKVVAAPGTALVPFTAPGPGSPVSVGATSAAWDIAATSRGGHVVRTEPQAPQATYLQEMLDEGSVAERTFPLSSESPVIWVIGFAQDRSARITDLEWVDPVGANPAELVPAVDVAVSVVGPSGPWEDLAMWPLERGSDGSVAPLSLPEPTWARYVRLAIPVPTDPAMTRWVTPATLRILEQPTGDTYRSILGEWGLADTRGPYEQLQARGATGSPAVSVADAPDAPDTPEDAQALEPRSQAPGQVRRNADVDWYAVSVPIGMDTLTISLRGDPVAGARPVLQDAEGRPVDTEPARTSDPALRTWTAIVTPGTYRIRVEQPVLSSVIAFDTSATVAPYLPAMRAAIGAFAGDITPGDEAVEILPFGAAPLTEGFSDQAYLVQGAMDAWVLTGGSSDVEATLTSAAADLDGRDGTHAILLLTDGVTTGFAARSAAWQALDRTGTVVFPVHVGGSDDPAVSMQLMLDLAASTGGVYQYATSQADLDRAFDRMATRLRQPADYSLSYETSSVGYAPGSIRVVPPEGGSVPIGSGVAVELVLDTSGSMLKPLEGRTRMAWAQEALLSLVDQTLPEGLAVALRTFRPARGSCDSIATVPLGPLDRAAVSQVIRDLKVNRKTRTPIGAALQAVPGDLGEVAGPRIVVLVTDGKETCKGDPAAAVKGLVEAGFETAINIVGYALEDQALKDEMASWAALGGGTFYDAQDQASLLAGIATTLQAPFRILDRNGALVGSGVVGGPAVELPVGTYRVEVLTEPRATFEAVKVGPAAGVELVVETTPAS